MPRPRAKYSLLGPSSSRHFTKNNMGFTTVIFMFFRFKEAPQSILNYFVSEKHELPWQVRIFFLIMVLCMFGRCSHKRSTRANKIHKNSYNLDANSISYWSADEFLEQLLVMAKSIWLQNWNNKNKKLYVRLVAEIKFSYKTFTTMSPSIPSLSCEYQTAFCERSGS